MRIAYVCADAGVPVFGTKGSSVHVMEMLGALLRTCAQIDLFAMRFDAELPAALAGVRVHALPPAPKGPQAREAHGLATNDDLAHMLRAAGPFDLIYERYSLWSYAALDVARETGAPYLLEVNAPLIEEQAEHRTLLRRADAEAIMRTQFSQASAVLAVSTEVAAYVRAINVEPAVARVQVLPNGVNTARFMPGLARATNTPFTVGFVGTLKPWHGLETLIDAFALLNERHAQTRLLMVGDGPQRAALEQIVLARGLLSSVRFTGAVQPDQVPALVTQFDVATAPYA
jgi:glycosyltransferase involved in cell wall biosynthesis